MKFIFSFVFLFSSVSFAHIEEGQWTGMIDKGTICSMNVGVQFFENQMPHPLNERIPVEVNGVKFVVGHPAIIDASTSTAAFNHDLFQGVVATPTGAQALVIEMIHTKTEEGPKNFTFIDHNYKTGEKSALVCKQIRHSI